MKNDIFILTCFLLAPFMVFAQDEPTPLWDLTQVVISEQLGVEFDAPRGWTIFRDEVHFTVYVAQDAHDFRMIVDTDALTLPQNPLITLSAAPLDAQAEVMTLEELAALSAQVSGVEISESFETSLLARPALYAVIAGTTTNRSGMMALWRQANSVFVFTLTIAATEINAEFTAAWELLLDSLRPTGTLALTETAEVSFLAYSIDYPTEWFVRVEQRSGFNSLNISEFSDTDAEPGYYIIVWTTRMADSTEDSNQQVAERLAGAFNITQIANIPIEEFTILGQHGIGMGWSSSTGETTYGILVPHTPVAELETYYIVIAPSQELLNDFWTTWIAMLQSVRLLE